MTDSFLRCPLLYVHFPYRIKTRLTYSTSVVVTPPCREFRSIRPYCGVLHFIIIYCKYCIVFCFITASAGCRGYSAPASMHGMIKKQTMTSCGLAQQSKNILTHDTVDKTLHCTGPVCAIGASQTYCYCCKKWRFTDNRKYTLTVIS